MSEIDGRKGYLKKKGETEVKKLAAVLLVVVILICIFAFPAQAKKPSNNLAGAQKVVWNLSADVMPVPPYGSRDIPGSDTASKLIVNQPNGKIEVNITGPMKSLNPNTEYKVYLSKEYEPYVYTGWSITGNWVIRAKYGSGSYDHDYTFNQSGGTFSGSGGYPASGPPYSITETVSGSVGVMMGTVNFHSDYDSSAYWYDATATIAADGTLSGTWGNTSQGYGHPWFSVSGNAVKAHTGDTGWSGLFTSTVPPFTFTTNADGAGSWHINLVDSDFAGPGTYTLSVWINEAGKTILISDNFEVVVD